MREAVEAVAASNADLVRQAIAAAERAKQHLGAESDGYKRLRAASSRDEIAHLGAV